MAQPEIHRKVHEDSPERCQSVMGSAGQCNNAKVPGCNFCAIHGGMKQKQSNDNAELTNYRLTKFKARVNDFANNPQVKSLREEVGIVRMQLEFLIEKCQDETDLLLYSDKITKLVDQISKLVLACQKLEEKSGNLLDKTQLFVICESFVKIIGDHVTDPDALDIINVKMFDTLTKSVATNPLADK